MAGSKRRFDVHERRARLGIRHRLASEARADTPADVAASLTALHSTDPATVVLGVRARAREPTVAALERALYDERTLVRMLGMRRTVFVVPDDAAPIVHAACTREIAERERGRLVALIATAGIAATEPERWLDDVAGSALRALAGRGEATAVELAQDEPRLRTQIVLAEGKAYQASQSISTRILFLLAAEGRIVRGRPKGSWISTQYRWSPVERWLPGGLAEPPTDQARAELVRRWLRAFGPGTLADVRWWSGWTVGQTRRALDAVGATAVDLEGDPQEGFVLPDDLEPVATPGPWVALLPALDTTVMGWNRRGWFLGDHGPMLFDRSGNAGPTVWCDGRIVGGWAGRKDGGISVKLLEDVGADASAAIRQEAERLQQWLGDVRVTPRFRTPLERLLAT